MPRRACRAGVSRSAETPLAAIWQDAPAFVRFRGTDWMPPPCRSCDQREIDWGGCRCQAFAVTGDAARTDPACAMAPDHATMIAAAAASAAPPPGFIYRRHRRGTEPVRQPATPQPAVGGQTQ